MRKKKQPPAMCHRRTLSDIVEFNTAHHVRGSNFLVVIGTECIGGSNYHKIAATIAPPSTINIIYTQFLI